MDNSITVKEAPVICETLPVSSRQTRIDMRSGEDEKSKGKGFGKTTRNCCARIPSDSPSLYQGARLLGGSQELVHNTQRNMDHDTSN